MKALGTMTVKHGNQDALGMLKQAAVDQEPWWMRMMAARAMKKIPLTEELKSFYRSRMEAEEENQLKRVWESLLGD